MAVVIYGTEKHRKSKQQQAENRCHRTTKRWMRSRWMNEKKQKIVVVSRIHLSHHRHSRASSFSFSLHHQQQASDNFIVCHKIYKFSFFTASSFVGCERQKLLCVRGWVSSSLFGEREKLKSFSVSNGENWLKLRRRRWKGIRVVTITRAEEAKFEISPYFLWLWQTSKLFGNWELPRSDA